jgi:hypothetical protein
MMLVLAGFRKRVRLRMGRGDGVLRGLAQLAELPERYPMEEPLALAA